jgi:hypothetical protein
MNRRRDEAFAGEPFFALKVLFTTAALITA